MSNTTSSPAIQRVKMYFRSETLSAMSAVRASTDRVSLLKYIFTLYCWEASGIVRELGGEVASTPLNLQLQYFSLQLR